MKTRNLLLMVLVLLSGMAVAAPAVTIQTPWKSNQKEKNLYQIITAWGFAVDNDALQDAIPLEGLPAGAYVIKDYTRYSNETELMGIYPLAITPPGRCDQPPDGAIAMLEPKQSGNWQCDLAFSASSDFGFYDDTKKTTILLTTQNQNSTSNLYGQSSGLIFDLGELNPLYSGQYIIAFEDGSKGNPFRDLDYNDLVVHVESLPLPGTLPLVGSGLLCLWLLGRYPRLFTSTSKFPSHHPPKRGGPA